MGYDKELQKSMRDELQEQMDLHTDKPMDTFHHANTIAGFFSEDVSTVALIAGSILSATGSLKEMGAHYLQTPAHYLWILEKVIDNATGITQQLRNDIFNETQYRAGLFLAIGYMYSIGIVPNEPTSRF